MRYLRAMAALLLLSTPTVADSIGVRSGVGIVHSGRSALYSINFETTFDKDFHHRFDIGFWTDTKPGHKGSLYTSFLLGKTIGNYNTFHVVLDLGVVAMSSPDTLLSSSFQFTEELSLGYNVFEVGYKHFSNAGITRPNIGRDYIFFNYRIQI